MANMVRNVAPFIDAEFWVTSIFGEQRTSSIHRGVDIATATASSLIERRIYSVSDGVVNHIGYDEDGYGNYLIIANDDGTGFLYAHLATRPTLNVGKRVTRGEFIATEGSTGQSTGLHLHLEYQRMVGGQWNYSSRLEDYLNPCDYLGINNIKNTSWIYKGTPYIERKQRGFKWILYINEIIENNESQQN